MSIPRQFFLRPISIESAGKNDSDKIVEERFSQEEVLTGYGRQHEDLI
jgi:hypothetical protein